MFSASPNTQRPSQSLPTQPNKLSPLQLNILTTIRLTPLQHITRLHLSWLSPIYYCWPFCGRSHEWAVLLRLCKWLRARIAVCRVKAMPSTGLAQPTYNIQGRLLNGLPSSKHLSCIHEKGFILEELKPCYGRPL